MCGNVKRNRTLFDSNLSLGPHTAHKTICASVSRILRCGSIMFVASKNQQTKKTACFSSQNRWRVRAHRLLCIYIMLCIRSYVEWDSTYMYYCRRIINLPCLQTQKRIFWRWISLWNLIMVFRMTAYAVCLCMRVSCVVCVCVLGFCSLLRIGFLYVQFVYFCWWFAFMAIVFVVCGKQHFLDNDFIWCLAHFASLREIRYGIHCRGYTI